MSVIAGMSAAEVLGNTVMVAGSCGSAAAFGAVGYDASERSLVADHGPEIAPELDVAAKAQTFMKSFDI